MSLSRTTQRPFEFTLEFTAAAEGEMSSEGRRGSKLPAGDRAECRDPIPWERLPAATYLPPRAGIKQSKGKKLLSPFTSPLLRPGTAVGWGLPLVAGSCSVICARIRLQQVHANHERSDTRDPR